jgi:hypothetical protein
MRKGGSRAGAQARGRLTRRREGRGETAYAKARRAGRDDAREGAKGAKGGGAKGAGEKGARRAEGPSGTYVEAPAAVYHAGQEQSALVA